MSLKINDFKNALSGGVRSNRYEVIIRFPAAAGGTEESEASRFLVSAAQIPAAQLGVIEQPYAGRMFKIPGDRVFPEWSITVLNDTNFTIRNAFERWSNAINSHEGNIGFSNFSDVYSDAEVHQLDNAGDRIKSYTFKDIWPSEVAAIDLSHDATDVVQLFTVALQYQEWVSDTTS